MMWRKEFGPKHIQSFEIFLLIVAVLVLIGIIMQSNFLLIAAAIFGVHMLVYKIVDNIIPEKLILNNPKRTIRLFPNEEAVWKIEFENTSFFPLVNGEMIFNLGSSIRVLQKNETADQYWKGLKMPVSIMPHKKVYLEVPLTALKRGTSRVSQLSYQFPHLFSYQKVILKYQAYYETEFVVYPKLKKVTGLETVFHMNPGESHTKHSPYEDIQSSIGTRDYHYTDSFQRINWKASVRAQELQTNVYENVIDRSFVFFVNLKQDSLAGAGERMENILSYSAYLCKYVTEQKLPYELFVNVFHPGKHPFLHQKLENQQTNLAKSLELLARIPRQAVITPFEEMLYHAVNTMQQPKTIIILGDIADHAVKEIQRLEQLRHTIFRVTETENSAKITPLVIERIA